LIMRLLTGAGTPREFQGQVFPWFFAILEPDHGLIAMIFVVTDNQGCRRRRLRHNRQFRLRREFVNGLINGRTQSSRHARRL
jgi:hypothetical protein